nr:MAG TPA: hypothetical protein [Caudoviricetes sp.]
MLGDCGSCEALSCGLGADFAGEGLFDACCNYCIHVCNSMQ